MDGVLSNAKEFQTKISDPEILFHPVSDIWNPKLLTPGNGQQCRSGLLPRAQVSNGARKSTASLQAECGFVYLNFFRRNNQITNSQIGVSAHCWRQIENIDEEYPIDLEIEAACILSHSQLVQIALSEAGFL